MGTIDSIDGYYVSTNAMVIYKCLGTIAIEYWRLVCSIGLPLFGDLTPFFVASCAMDVGVGAPNRSDHAFLHFGDPPVIQPGHGKKNMTSITLICC